MSVNVTLTWLAPSDANGSTTYKITRRVRGVETVLNASQAQSGGAGTQQTYTDTGYTPSPGGLKTWEYLVYRDQGGSGDFAPPAVFRYFYPTKPKSNDTCVVYGVYEDSDDTGNNGVTVTAKLSADVAFNSLGEYVNQLTSTTATDADGYWELDLYRQARIVEPAATTYTFTVGTFTSTASVPDQHTANFADIED